MNKQTQNLQKTEELLWNFITAPEGVQKALEEHPDTHLPIRPSAPLSPAERLDIYADMYFYRIRDSLKEDFPAVLKIIGEDRFHNLITDYLIKHPSTSYTLRDVGKKLPDFLGTHPLSGKYPFLPDLARLEWLIIESFDAPDSKTLSVDDLKAFAPDQWPHLTFKFVDSFHLMESGWPVGTLHNRPVSEAKEAKPKSEKLRIWRFDLTVYTRIVDDEEYSLLMMIQKGKPFGDICEALAGTCGFEQAVPTAAKKLSGWLKNGLLKEAKL